MRAITIPGLNGESAFIDTIDTTGKAGVKVEFFFQLSRLYKQLTDGNVISVERLMGLASANHAYVFIMHGSNLIASVTLISQTTATKEYGLVEDLVVDQTYTGKGLAKVLLIEAISWGRARSCEFLQLTCKPTRPTANMLYPKMGFALVAMANPDVALGTNLYRRYLNGKK